MDTNTVYIALEKTVFAPGETITVKTTGITEEMENSQAFIGIYYRAAGHNTHQNTECPQAGSGTVELTAPLEADSYEVRFYKAYDGKFFQAFVESIPITVSGPELPQFAENWNSGQFIAIDKTEYAPGEAIMVERITEELNPQIGIYEKGGWYFAVWQNAFLNLLFMDDPKILYAPEYNGSYEIRIFKQDNGWVNHTVIETIPFTVRGGTEAPARAPSGNGHFDVLEFGGIDWLVLDVKDGKALIISDNVLFSTTYGKKTWEACTLRAYLNESFYQGFTESDRARILPTTLKNPDNQWYGAAGGNDTNDYIFLLSIEEAVEYFGDSGELLYPSVRYDSLDGSLGNYGSIDDPFNENRTASYNGYVHGSDYTGDDRNQDWWLRSPGEEDSDAAFVFDDGRIYVKGMGATLCGIRPAMWISLDGITNPPGKPSGIPSPVFMEPPPSVELGDLSLSLNKSTYAPGETIAIKVTGLTPEMAGDRAFVAIYKEGARHDGYLDYRYPKEGTDTVMITAPYASGTYEIRLFKWDDDGSADSFLMKVTFTVK